MRKAHFLPDSWWRGLLTSVCVAALSTVPAAAQSPPSGPLTLGQVLELAEQRSEAMAIARAGMQRAEGDEIRARSGLLPQLDLSGSYERALASEFSGVFDDAFLGYGGGSGDTSGSLEDLPFGRENTWRVSLAFSQNLYSGGRIGSQRAVAAAGTNSAGLALRTTRGQLLFDATQAYYDAALSDRLVAIAGATIEQATATLNQTELAFQAGTQPEFEVLRARVTRDTQNPTLIRQRVNREIAHLRLKQLLDLPPTYDLELADALSDDVLPPAPAFAERLASVEITIQAGDQLRAILQSATPLVERTAVQELVSTVRLREASLSLVRAQRTPSVSLISNYQRIAYPTNALPTFDRSNWTLGVSAQIPILTGGRQRGDELVARAELEQARAQLQLTEELAELDSRSAWAEILAAVAAWEATAGTVEQAGRAYEIAEVRYQAGVSTQLELSDSRLLLQQAEVNRALAARDLQVVRARVALLEDLPIAGGGAAGSGGVQQQPVTPQPQPAQGGNGQLQNAAAQGGAQRVGG